jgi:hypothetical protein
MLEAFKVLAGLIPEVPVLSSILVVNGFRTF